MHDDDMPTKRRADRAKDKDAPRRRPAKGGEPQTDPGVKIWDEDSQRLMESLSHDRKQATEEDYEHLDNMGNGVTRGDTGPQ
jgi:hypothetical protein